MSSPQQSEQPEKAEKKVDPWSITGYLIAGMVFYGGVGYLVDRWAGTHNLFAPIGIIFGLAAGLYLTFRQLSVLERQEREALTRAKRLERFDDQERLRARQRQQGPQKSQEP
jgi:ATP synthase protein I